MEIEEGIIYKKLEKIFAKNSNPNGMVDSGTLTEGELKINLDKFSTGEQFFKVYNLKSGYYVRSSPIIDILPIENGYQISTENSIYRITQ